MKSGKLMTSQQLVRKFWQYSELFSKFVFLNLNIISVALVILDFSNVLGLDSSAAQSIAKLKSFILKNFSVEILLFVTGSSEGFKCSYNLSQRVVDSRHSISFVEKISSPQHEHRLSLAAGALLLNMNPRVGSLPRSLIVEFVRR